MFDDIQATITPEEEEKLSEQKPGKINTPLSSEESFLAHAKHALIIISYNQIQKAKKLRANLESDLNKSDEQTKARYEEIIVWLLYVALPELSQLELSAFFSNRNIAYIFRDAFDNDLKAKVKLRLATLPLEERDNWREKMYRALHENNTILTKQFLDEAKKGSIAGWLKKYDFAVGNGIANAIDRAEFENKSGVDTHLNNDERAILKRLLDFYEYLKRSSYDTSEPDQDVIIVGQDSDVDAKKAIQHDKIEEKAENFTKYSFEQVQSSAHDVLTRTNGDTSAIYNELFNSLAPHSVATALSSLLLLAQLRQLDNVLEHDQFMALVAQDLQNKGQGDSMQELRINFRSPQYIARFLKVVLEDKLNLAHTDAIAFGEKLSKILAMEGEKYQSIIKDGNWKL